MPNLQPYPILKLDTFDLSVPLSVKLAELRCLLNEKAILPEMPSESRLAVRSKAFSLPVEFYISFQFCGEDLDSVHMSPCEYLTGKALYVRYRLIQNAIRRETGFWVVPDPFRAILNILVPDSRRTVLVKNGDHIEHCLLERFVVEEHIEIQMRR